MDVVFYSGLINKRGYEAVCDVLKEKKKSDTALLVIGTPGGDPDAGFRIARALQHNYSNGFGALVPRYCKSAGTLALLGANMLYMADRSELGPLDIQIKKGDELYGRNSGLDINQAVDFLKNEALVTFNEYMHQLVMQGLSTKIAADIAVRLVSAVYEPISGQIEPLRLAEMNRAMNITYNYGRRLAEVGKNLIPNGLETLVGSYPSHGFVIDRKEARNIFKSVQSPEGTLEKICDNFDAAYGGHVNDGIPVVALEVHEPPVPTEGEVDDQSAPNVGEAAPVAANYGAGVTANGAAHS